MSQEIAAADNLNTRTSFFRVHSRRDTVHRLLESHSELRIDGRDMATVSVAGLVLSEMGREVSHYASKLSLTARLGLGFAGALGLLTTIAHVAAPSGLEPKQIAPVEPVSSPSPVREPVIQISCVPLVNGRKDKEAGGPYPLPGVGSILLKYREAFVMEPLTEAQRKMYQEVEDRVEADRGSVKHVPNARVKGDDGCVVPLTEY